MKEKIYTIPVNEAFDADGECPFCTMREKLKNDAINYVLGPSYMEEDIRSETDKLGFCREHIKNMYERQNSLGIALMLSTHFEKINQALRDMLKKEPASGKKTMFSRGREDSCEAAEFIDETVNSCYVCERIEENMDRYTDTFFYLWKTESEFREKVLRGKGFCIEHFSMLLKEGMHRLSNSDYKEFYSAVSKLETDNLERVRGDLLWFIDKFDYRFRDEPWKNSKDALPRSIQKLIGENIEEDKENGL